VDNQIDISTGTVKVKAIFPNQDGALFPNQFVNVRLVVNELKEATVIPSAAVQRGAQGTFVWLLDEDKTVAMRPVGVSAADGERVAVLDGLKPGDQVAVDGFDRLREKARVEVVSQESRVVHAGPGKRGHHGGGHRRGDAGEPAAAASVRPQP
jgi:multidrug efflux system membrane fusion protein